MMNFNKKIVNLSVFLLIFSFIFITGCLHVDFLIGKIIDTKNDLDFHYFSYTKIVTEGNNSINNIVTDTSHYGKSPQRLNKIADLIIQNFTDPFWQYQENDFCIYYRHDGSNWTDWCMYYGDTSFADITYRHDKNGAVRVQKLNDLSNDPRWIAYQKTGACQDTSILFNETANRSGFISRVVRANGIGHFWVEVYIDNEWRTFDVQKYGNRDINSMNWSGNTADYVNNSDFSSRCQLVKCGVYVFDQRKGYAEPPITESYDPNLECIHGTFNSSDCKK